MIKKIPLNTHFSEKTLRCSKEKNMMVGDFSEVIPLQTIVDFPGSK